MLGLFKRYIEALERFLRIDDTLDVASRARARITYVIGIVFVAIQLVNLSSMQIVFGQWTTQHYLPLVASGFAIIMTLMLRYTKSGAFFGSLYALACLIAIGIGAMLSSVSGMPPPGINSALLPVLCGVSALIAFIGTRLITAFYIAASLCLIGILYTVTAATNTDPALMIMAWDRAMQAAIGLLLVGPISLVIADMLYDNLKGLEEVATEARRAERDRADFLAMMSHEIRTPLHGIIGLSDMLSKSDLAGPETRYAELIRVSTENLMEIVDEVLDMAKLEGGVLQISAEPFDPRFLLRNLSDLFAIKAAKKGLWLDYDVDEAMPVELIGDAPHLRQVLSNLVGNAIKFTQNGGVRVGARRVGQSKDHVLVQFYVQDSGVGIAEDQQDAVFNRFSQSDSAKTTTTKGTGLGLSICRQLTEMMGGTLLLASTPGRGTVFHFTLALPAIHIGMPPQTETEAGTEDPLADAA